VSPAAGACLSRAAKVRRAGIYKAPFGAFLFYKLHINQVLIFIFRVLAQPLL
jgi:hypothetical protein